MYVFCGAGYFDKDYSGVPAPRRPDQAHPVPSQDVKHCRPLCGPTDWRERRQPEAGGLCLERLPSFPLGRQAARISPCATATVKFVDAPRERAAPVASSEQASPGARFAGTHNIPWVRLKRVGDAENLTRRNALACHEV